MYYLHDRLYTTKVTFPAEFSADYDALLDRHVALYGEIFYRMVLNLEAEGRDRSDADLLDDAHAGGVPTALIERMYDYGRYLLICSSGRWPANLQGVWNGDYAPAWESDYHNDENIQMNYWQALPGNMPELTHSYFGYYELFLDDYAQNARKLFGCRGIWVPIAQTTHGRAYPGPWSNWPSAAAWLAQLFYDYWLYMDVAIAREVLNNLCQACEAQDIQAEDVARWRSMLAKLPEYEVNPDGDIHEWLWPRLEDNYSTATSRTYTRSFRGSR